MTNNSVTTKPKIGSGDSYSRSELYYKQFENFILKNDHPCVMAQAAFKANAVSFEVFQEPMHAEAVTLPLLQAIRQYTSEYNFEDNDFQTLIAIFPNHRLSNERDFETALWRQLQLLHNADSKKWDDSVSRNPDDNNFSFSLNAVSFYIIGMHPESSRNARKAPFTTIVFNLHAQFEKLRDMNAYETVRDRIRGRDASKNGSINPMLEDFGKKSEAAQYSGRNVDSTWKCPFLNKQLTYE